MEYRLRILKQADACKKPGELGALLRQSLWNSREWSGRHTLEVRFQSAFRDVKVRFREKLVCQFVFEIVGNPITVAIGVIVQAQDDSPETSRIPFNPKEGTSTKDGVTVIAHPGRPLHWLGPESLSSQRQLPSVPVFHRPVGRLH